MNVHSPGNNAAPMHKQLICTTNIQFFNQISMAEIMKRKLTAFPKNLKPANESNSNFFCFISQSFSLEEIAAAAVVCNDQNGNNNNSSSTKLTNIGTKSKAHKNKQRLLKS